MPGRHPPSSRQPSRHPRQSASTASTADYLRQARRIRAKKNLSPSARQAALRALTPQSPASSPRVSPQPTPVFRSPRLPEAAPGILSIPADTATAFSLEVITHLSGGILRYTARRHLLARASRMGIPPFEANLLIASVLHTHRPKVIPITQRTISPFHIAATITLLTTMLAIALFL